MSTLNVANISDDQSTLTSSANPSDLLNNTTTVDTKFVTNGCAKAFGACRADGSYYENSGATLNISSTENLSTGEYLYNFANDMITLYPASSDCTGANYRAACIRGRGTGKVEVYVRTGVDGSKADNANMVIVMGDLA